MQRGKVSRRTLFYPAILLLFSGACTTTLPDRRDVSVDVPFTAQAPENCGVTALDMILRYKGISADFNTLKQKVFVPALHGTTPELIAVAAQGFGLRAEKTRGDLPSLRTLLAEGTAPIIFFGPARSQTNGHFVVVTGIKSDLGRVRIHSGDHANEWVQAGKFVAMWKRGNYTMLVIRKQGTDRNQ